MSNWENPLRGTPDLVEEVFANVLDTCAKGNADKYSDLLNSLWLSNLNNVSWLSKSKYPPMVVLLPRIGVEKVSCTKKLLFTNSSLFGGEGRLFESTRQNIFHVCPAIKKTSLFFSF